MRQRKLPRCPANPYVGRTAWRLPAKARFRGWGKNNLVRPRHPVNRWDQGVPKVVLAHLLSPWARVAPKVVLAHLLNPCAGPMAWRLLAKVRSPGWARNSLVRVLLVNPCAGPTA